jgi:hypothetical protein
LRHEQGRQAEHDAVDHAHTEFLFQDVKQVGRVPGALCGLQVKYDFD